jgi:two-component system, response regulator PdtaR
MERVITTKKKIVILEDEIIIALDLKHRLENLGYDVPHTAFNGSDALKLTGQTDPDLVLMDIQLNGEMDGIKVAQQIRSLYNIPFIYITGSHDSSLLKKAKETGPVGFINKPFDDIEINNALKMATNTNMTTS